MGQSNHLLYRGFSKQDYRQLRSILSEESRSLLKRPQYIIGNILIIGSVFYFIFRAFMPETFQWPKADKMVGLAVAIGVGVIVIWLLLQLLKFRSVFAKLFIPIWGAWILFFGIVRSQPSFEVKWEYIIYAVLVFSGWLCCCSSIKGHFCEKIFMSRRKGAKEVPK